MVSRDYILRAALSHDTQTARAFLRALGVEPPIHAGPGRSTARGSGCARRDVEWCVRNWGSPMDGRR